jgi:signal peptidase I
MGLVVPAWLVAIYLVINLLMPLVPLNPQIKTYLLQPLLWGLTVLLTRFLSGYRSLAKPQFQRTFIQIGLGTGLLQVCLAVICGLFIGFGKNPASLTPLGIIENIFWVGSMLAGMEISRAWLMARWGRRRTYLALGLITILFTLLAIPFSQITSFQIRIQSTSLVVSAWVPLLAENLLASFLALLAGARASLAYRGVLAVFWWFCPVLPDLNFALKGVIGVAMPIMGIIAASSIYTLQSNRGQPRRRARKAAFPTGWIVTALMSVIIVWFAVGAFPFQPSVVPTGSMIPAVYPGDVVIVAKTQVNNLKLGDIIEYHRESIDIVHRIIAVQGEGEQRSYITKGDNNNAPDGEPVPAKNVIGKVVFNIPKVGWVALLLKSLVAGGP